MEEKIVYFEQPGKEHTEATLKLALERARARGIKKVVLASTWGDTARAAAERWSGTGIKIIVVPHQFGFMFETKQHFPEELVNDLEKAGHKVHFASMLFHSEDLLQNNASRGIANMLRTFCQGMKVVVEIILMAADGGHVLSGEQVVAVAGTGRGADTAVVAYAASSNHIGDLHVTEIICKPLQTKQFGPGGPPPAPPK
ncbi:MAG TPA: pyruvate kinase alpha/beta domain-containing protein [Dehalococcoidales bacterium]|nr:pyruvate kinase alpha/beta domain-containing protein [Dehalococcoidales bacterium]